MDNYLFCKGADNKMVEILTGGVDGEQKIAIDKLNSHQMDSHELDFAHWDGKRVERGGI